MKHELFRLALKGLRGLAAIKQIGNPAGKAPSLATNPSGEEKILHPLGASDDVFVWHLHDITCSGLYGGAILNKHNQVYSRFLSFPWGKELHPSLFSPYLGRRAAALGKAILLITPAPSTNYYHWIADVLPRLLLIMECEMTDFTERWIVLHQSQRSYESDTFNLLGIQTSKIVRLKPFETIEADDAIIADFLLSFDGHPFPLWKKKLLDTFKNKAIRKAEGKVQKKIYLLRGKQKTRCLIGEERLTILLQEKGFDIVDPQQMTLEEQINTLANAQTVVALHGAALTNIIFCPEQTLILELRSTHKPPEYFSEIAKTYNFRFESISIPPEKTLNAPHLANEQNLILTEQSIEELLAKL